VLVKNDLGITEQLCSQMSQYAIMHHIAKRNGHEFVFLRQSYQLGRGVLLTKAFDLPNRIISKQQLRFPWNYLPSNHTFTNLEPKSGERLDPRLSRLSPLINYNLTGLFGLYRDWEPNKKEIFNIFRFRRNILLEAESKMCLIRSEHPNHKKLVSIHFRRTDYLESPVHANLSEDYYQAALKHLNNNDFIYVVFSDDINWCRQQAFLQDLSAIFSSNTNLVDLAMMSLCDHHIISNSSFSFWGALLNHKKSKKVVCPRNYIKPSVAGYQWINGNYYPDTWRSIDNA
jgi:hypothetical protein